MSSANLHPTLSADPGRPAQGPSMAVANLASFVMFQLDSASYPITANTAGTFRVYDPANPTVNDGVRLATRCYVDVTHNILYVLRQAPGADLAIADGTPLDVSCPLQNQDGGMVTLYWKGTFSKSSRGYRFVFGPPYPQVQVIPAS
jgi:hypothetical protein